MHPFSFLVLVADARTSCIRRPEVIEWFKSIIVSPYCPGVVQFVVIVVHPKVRFVCCVSRLVMWTCKSTFPAVADVVLGDDPVVCARHCYAFPLLESNFRTVWNIHVHNSGSSVPEFRRTRASICYDMANRIRGSAWFPVYHSLRMLIVRLSSYSSMYPSKYSGVEVRSSRQ